jgi:hypothetical protein|tara:strand:- start:321 stop:1166 length:846 start_codon:yes stop_codon:yes gene_type:complete
MKKLKHSKYKNTGILFELLVRQIATDTLNNADSLATKIIKEHFGKSTELSKELRLYKSAIEENFDTEYKASEFVNIILTERTKLNESVLNRQKYNLIKTIKKNFVIEDFFKYRVSNYKENASIYKLFEHNNSDNPKEYVDCKATLMESLTGNSTQDKVINTINEEYSKQPKEVRLLAWKMLVENFNNKYTTLTEKQQDILREYINSVDNSEKLKKFVVRECNSLSKNIKSVKVTDRVTKIKVNEVVKLISKVKSSKVITEAQILSLLRYTELHNELKRVFK